MFPYIKCLLPRYILPRYSQQEGDETAKAMTVEQLKLGREEPLCCCFLLLFGCLLIVFVDCC